MFQKATKKKAKAKVALIGPSGSGKTYTALQLAKTLGKRIAVIDTERGSASKYSGDVADFEVCELTQFAPQRYIDALHFAANEGYDVIVIDSLSHAWTGEGGILDQKDKQGGKFDGWRTLTPQHNALVDALLGYPGHLIATMRVKTEYVVEKDERGKSVPRKIGLAPVQRDGLEYEFDVVADMDPDNCMHIAKTRCPALAGQSIRKPGADVARQLLAWLEDGVEPPKRRGVLDVIVELARRGEVAAAKDAARKAWRNMTQAEKDRTQTEIAAAEQAAANEAADLAEAREAEAEAQASANDA